MIPSFHFVFGSALRLLGGALFLGGTAAMAGSHADLPPVSEEAHTTAWERLNAWNIGGVLFPRLDIVGVGGWTDGEARALATGEHDPSRQAFSAQAIEPAVSLRTERVDGFANAILFQDAGGDWEAEWEEAFLKFRGPAGLELKGGQYLGHYGITNRQHLHSWDYVDADLASTRFLGGHGLLLRGANLDWTLPTRSLVFSAVASLGYADSTAGHSHGHNHHHGHGSHEGEDLWLEDGIWTARLAGRYRATDFHQFTGGVSLATGDNGFHRSTDVYGVDLEYLWRERGLEPGGRALRWRNEVMFRRAYLEDDHGHGHHEHGHHGHGHHGHGHGDSHHGDRVSDWGMASSVIYTWNEQWDTGMRFEYVDGTGRAGLGERWRVSPVATWFPLPDRRLGLRVQYNLDDLDHGGTAHSVWFQVRLTLGSLNEVR